MPGRFEGMSDAEWELFEGVFPKKARKGSGMPAAHPRKVLNPPLARSSARRAMGIKKRRLPPAEGHGIQPEDSKHCRRRFLEQSAE